MFLFKKDTTSSTKEFQGTVTNAKNIIFYNEKGQEEYINIASSIIRINKTLNYIGKQIQSASIEITTDVLGYADIENRHIENETYTLGSENEEDFYFVELGIENADVTITISKTQNGELTNIHIDATGNIQDGITMLKNN